MKYSNISTTRMAGCQNCVNILNNETNNFYNFVTFNQTNFIFETPSGTPNNGWYNLSYTPKNYDFWNTSQDAISLADPDVDFSSYNIVFIITNNPDFGGTGGGPWHWKVNDGIETILIEDGLHVNAFKHKWYKVL